MNDTRITRNKNGAIKVGDYFVGMYDFTGWLVLYNIVKGTKITPATATDKVILEYWNKKTN